MTELEFAYRVRQALDESVDRLDHATAVRLQVARQKALARMNGVRPGGVPLGALQALLATGPGRRWRGWAWRVGALVPAFALVMAVVGIKEWQSERTMAEVADVDFAVLMDDTPIDTYAHKGFSVLLRDEEAHI